MATLYLVKLGGAAVTDKAAHRELRAEPLEALAAAVGAARASLAPPGSSLVLIHGAGSFGHHEAREHGRRRGRHACPHERVQHGRVQQRE